MLRLPLFYLHFVGSNSIHALSMHPVAWRQHAVALDQDEVRREAAAKLTEIRMANGPMRQSAGLALVSAGYPVGALYFRSNLVSDGA